MAKQNIDWSNLGFGYIPTGERYVSNYKDGKWDDGVMTTDSTITMSECAPSTFPASVGTPRRMFAVAGAGTGRMPWAHRTCP